MVLDEYVELIQLVQEAVDILCEPPKPGDSSSRVVNVMKVEKWRNHCKINLKALKKVEYSTGYFPFHTV